jgi:SET domain
MGDAGMNYSLKSRTVIAHMLPGVILIGAIGLIFLVNPTFTIPSKLDAFFSTATTSGAVGVGLIALILFLALLVGLFLDAFRERLEGLWDSFDDKDSTWWDFFFTGATDEVAQLDDYYYSYYQLDANFTLVSIILSLFSLWSFNGLNWFLPFPLVAGVLFFWDGLKLRQELKRLVQEYLRGKKGELPHCKVKARLRPSSLCEGGVGVFAIRNIQKGNPIFFGDDGKINWISRHKLDPAALSDEAKQLYRDFAIFKGDKCGCPQTFDGLTVAWYLNEPNLSDTPNVECRIDESYQFYAARDIKKGEELTARYSDYSEAPWPELSLSKTLATG